MDGLEFYNPLEEEVNVTQETVVENTIVQPGTSVQEVIDNFKVEETTPPEGDKTTEEEITTSTEEVKTEESSEEEVPQDFEESVTGIANYLSSNGLIKDVPKDIDLENFQKEDFVKLIKHNVETEGRTKFEEGVKFANEKLVGKLDGFTQKILSYNIDNPNADEKDIQEFVGALMYSEDITNLTVENNAEKIVREYYKTLNWESASIEKKIVQLTQLEGALAEEATILKPKLDAKSQSIANQKLEDVRKIKEFEDELQTQLQKRVTSTLDTGKLNGVELSKDEARFLYAATMNNDTPVTIKGKKVEMGFAEALIRNAKYNPKSNMEDFMLGLLIIQKGASAIEKFYAKKANTKVAEEFTKNFKFSNNKKKVTSVPTQKEISTGIPFKI